MKMKINTIIISFATIIILATSCLKEIEFDAKLIAPKLVINGFITNDSLIDVTIGLSKSIIGVERDFEWVDNADAFIYVDGIRTEKLETYKIEYEDETNENDYWYYRPVRPNIGYRTVNTLGEAGKTYKIEVSHADYGTASAETTIPLPVEIMSLNASTTITKESYGDYEIINLVMKLKFNDPPNEENYYRLTQSGTIGTSDKFQYYYGEKEDSSFIIVRNFLQGDYIQSNDPVFSSEEDPNDFLFGSPSSRYNVFTDHLIDGKEYEISFTARSEWFYSPGEEHTRSGFVNEEGEFQHISVKLSTLSPEAFLYIKSAAAHRWYDGDFFAEPVQVFSNVKNGVGIFAGYSSSIITYKEGEYPLENIDYKYVNEGNYYW